MPSSVLYSSPIYSSFTILHSVLAAKDPSDDISNQLSAKLGIKGRIKSLNGKTSASPDATAKKPMAPNPQATKLATAMTQKVPYVLATKGVGSEMEQDFQEGE